MSIIIEAPYIWSLKEEYLTIRCSACFKLALNKCSDCQVMVYCNDECQMKDKIYHKIECESYKKNWNKNNINESVIARMIVRVLTRLNLDNGQPKVDLCTNVSKSIPRRSWFDLLGHRDEIFYSDRHLNIWLNTKKQFEFLFKDQFNHIDLLEIFGKILINRFRVGIFENVLNGRIAVGWAIYLTTSRFNHSCQPDLLQCSFDINMRLKFSDLNKKIPEITNDFENLTVSYRHQNDFRLTNPLSYVPTRKQRRNFVSFFFFNCHCSFCGDDLFNRYLESSTNRLCNQCQDSLVLLEDYNQSNYFILTCLGRSQCSNTQTIIDRIHLPFINNNEQSIDKCEEKLEKIEELLHPKSTLLLQQRETLFFHYEKILKENNFNENQRTTFITRAIQLGALLIESYDFHLKHSSIYPKIFLTDLANLCLSIGKIDQAKQFYDKAFNLWISDYNHLLDFTNFYQKLSLESTSNEKQ